MPEETTTTTTPAPEAEAAPKTPTSPLTPEILKKATEGTGELDANDHMELERRFGIKRMHSEEEAEVGSEETSEAGTEEAAPPPAEEGTPPAEEEAPTMKAKIDGQEVEINVREAFPEFAEVWGSLNDTQKKRILAMHQKDVAASKRFSQANLTKKQMQQLMSLLKEDPIAVLQHPSLNHNVRELVEKWLVEQIEYEQMDPRDRELADAKRALAEKEKKEREAKKQAEQQEIEQLQGKYTEHYQKDIISAIEESGLPRSTETVARIAYYLKEALKPRKKEDGTEAPGVRLKAADVVDLVRDDYQRMMQRLVGQADAETLIGLFGDGFTEKIRKHLLNPIKKTGETPEKQATVEGGTPKKRKPLSKEEWRKRLDERTG